MSYFYPKYSTRDYNTSSSLYNSSLGSSKYSNSFRNTNTNKYSSLNNYPSSNYSGSGISSNISKLSTINRNKPSYNSGTNYHYHYQNDNSSLYSNTSKKKTNNEYDWKISEKNSLYNSVRSTSNIDIFDKYMDKTKDKFTDKYTNKYYDKFTDKFMDSTSDKFLKNKNVDNEVYDEKKELNNILSNKIGLMNLGNTCFMNAGLQILIHTEYFIKKLFSKKSNINLNTPITLKFYNLCIDMRSPQRIRAIAPSEFKQKFGSKHTIFSGYGQNDSQEFCRVLLEDINKELNDVKIRPAYKELNTTNKSKIQCDKEFDELFRSRESSIVMDAFYGQIINIFTCSCGQKSYSFQKIVDLPLLLSSNNQTTKYDTSITTINDLLDLYFEGETIQFGTKCEKCGKKSEHQKEIKFSRPPNILILSLQRVNMRTQRKNNSKISFPEVLNISKYIDGECGHGNEGKYTLYGVGNHSGTINFGHYYAYIKLNNQLWYEFNDSTVSNLGSINTTSNSVYSLFYAKN